jgi:beta-glucanase (GH16 family)
MTPALLLTLALAASSAGADDWKLVWSDEFATDGLPDASRWDYEEGFVRNREAQYYTRANLKNARVENGVLVIEARKEHLAKLPAKAGRRGRTPAPTEAEYSSASLTTRGKASWSHGRIEVRAKLPTGRGTWPAIWTLGTNIDKAGWPRCGEIDIMENVGFDPNLIHANVHTEKYNHTQQNNKGSKITIDKPYAEFHVYAVEWSAKKMDFFVDDKKYFTYENEGTGAAAWPYDKPQYLILNVAIGGDWGGQKGIDDAIFPQRMEIDYVRVYQKQPAAEGRK